MDQHGIAETHALSEQLLDDDNSAFEKVFPPNKKVHVYNELDLIRLIEKTLKENSIVRIKLQALADMRLQFLN